MNSGITLRTTRRGIHRLRAAAALTLLAMIAAAPSLAAAEMIAERVTESNAARYLYDTPERAGGVGDWYMANDVVWAIIDDPSNPNVISSSGGTLVDLGLLSHKGEQFIQLMPLLNMTRDLVVPFDEIRAETGEDWASITVTASHGLRPEKPGFGVLSKEDAEKLIVETEYLLRAGESFMRLKTTIRNTGDKKGKIFYCGDVIYWGDDVIKPFVGSVERLGKDRGAPRGFEHPLINTSSLISILKGTGGFNYIAGGGVEGMPPISYGICSPSEYKKEEMLWGINDRLVSAVGAFTGSFSRPLHLLKTFFFGIPPGGEFVYERVLVVGDRNDVASSTDAIFQLLGTVDGDSGVVGKVEPAGADTSILIFTADAELPVTQIRPARRGENAGAFRASLPPGEYTAKIRSICRDPDLSTPEMEPITREFTVAGSSRADIGTIKLPDLSTLRVEVFEGDARSPARVIVSGADGTPDPEWGSDLQGFTLGGKATPTTYGGNWLLLDGTETGPIEAGLRPGKYVVRATYGFEYSVDEMEIDLSKPGSEANIRLGVERVIDTPGMINGDFHVHGAPSPDSAVSYERRVKSFVADGVDLLIATDHDALMEYGPVIERMNLSHRLMSIVGVEATSTQMVSATPFTIGHTNAWPLRYDPNLPRWGMFYDEGLRPRDLFDRIREIADGEPVIQINHGREGSVGGEGSYFNALGVEFDKPLGYDPTLPLTESPNNLLLVANSNGTRDIDFDTIEVLNGYWFSGYMLLRDDWFSLLNQGYAKAGAANSDTHIMASLAGYPRNYILLKDPKAKRADKETLCEQIRGLKLFGTTGPIIALDVNGEATMGDTITAKDGKVALNIKVSAAPWVPLDVIHIYANGELLKDIEAGPQSKIVRLDKGVSLTLEKDTWLIVEAATKADPETGEPTRPGGLYNIIAPKFAPLAFTNPIFVDVDGNGRFDPPGILPRAEK